MVLVLRMQLYFSYYNSSMAELVSVTMCCDSGSNIVSVTVAVSVFVIVAVIVCL